MECAQLRVTGGGSTNPTTYNIPGIYSGSDPGIKFNLYAGATTYSIPGPRPFSCSGGSTPPRTTSPPVVSSTKTSSVPTATSTAPSTGGAGTVAQWGQCGGANYTGATGCVSPYTCVKVNDYYYQCQ